MNIDKMNDDYISRKSVLEHYQCVDPAGTFAFCNSILDFVSNLPAADVQPVRKGAWIESEEEVEDDWGYVTIRSITCSNCGYKESQSSLGGGSLTKSNFCPYCGAKMGQQGGN